MLQLNMLRLLFSGFVYTLLFFTMWRLFHFLSAQDYLGPPSSPQNEPYQTLFVLFKDAMLLALFVFQHSFMAFLSKYSKRNILWRSVYVAATCLALQLLMRSWISTHDSLIWKLDNKNLQWIFTLCHFFSWMVIYGGALLMDFAELTGTKKAYYKLYGWGDPMHQKSIELQRLFAHMRHPCFTGLNVILWCHPVMTLDRLLLALGLTIYMVVCFNVDSEDYLYQKEQCARKMTALGNTQSHQFNRM